MARVLGLEPRITESKSVVLPLHYTRTKTWHPARDSNSHQGFWRPVCCHYTSETQLWWTVTGSNRSLRLAKPSCPQQHLQPIILNALLPMRVLKHTVITTILLRVTADMSVQCALIRCDFLLYIKSSIPQAAHLQFKVLPARVALH